MASSSAGRLV